MQNKIILLKVFFSLFKYMQFSTFDFIWIYFVRSSVLYGKCFHHFRIFERYHTKLRTGHFQQRWRHHQARRPGRLVGYFFYLNHTPTPPPPPCPFAQKRHEVLLSPSIANTCNIYSSQLDFLKIIWREKKITTYTPSVFYFWIDIVNLLKT